MRPGTVIGDGDSMTTQRRTALREQPPKGFELPETVVDVFTDLELEGRLDEYRRGLSAARERHVQPRLHRVRKSGDGTL
jgi:hypothetical protein